MKLRYGLLTALLGTRQAPALSFTRVRTGAGAALPGWRQRNNYESTIRDHLHSHQQESSLVFFVVCYIFRYLQCKYYVGVGGWMTCIVSIHYIKTKIFVKAPSPRPTSVPQQYHWPRAVSNYQCVCELMSAVTLEQCPHNVPSQHNSL